MFAGSGFVRAKVLCCVLGVVTVARGSLLLSLSVVHGTSMRDLILCRLLLLALLVT